ncbi:MAG: hypothetical protein ACYDA8_12435 [Deferrisomatales bacterium]
MKRLKILLAGAAVVTSGVALAAINPATPGLPQGWNMTGTQGYGSTAAVQVLPGNPGSAMCVECHSANPSAHISAPSKSNGYTASRTNNLDWGSHTIMNTLAMTNRTDPRAYTNSGGGFTGGFGTQPRDNGAYMRSGVWSMTGGSGGVSKYNISNDAGGKVISVLGTALPGTIGWANADMVCESCHNVLMNRGNQLFLGDYADNGTDVLCVGCHAAGPAKGSEGTTYEAFHANGNMQNFNKTRLKRHHVLTADTLATAYYDPDGNAQTNDAIMWAPNFSDRLGTGTYATFAMDTPLAAGASIAWRGKNNVSGVGTRSAALGAGDIREVNGTTVTCANCHRPHNARSEAGAFVLRTGNAAAFPNPSTGANNAASGTKGYGLRRQADVGDHSAVGSKVYGEYAPLCQGCHIGYGG